MKESRRIANNIINLFTGQTLAGVLAMVVTVWLARHLGDEGFGYWAFVQSIIIYLIIVVDLGLTAFGTREIAKNPHKANTFVTNILGIRLFIALILFVIFVSIVLFLDISLELKLLLAGSAIWLFPQALNPEFVFQGLERMRGTAAWRAGIQLLFLVPVVFFIHQRADLWKVPYFRAFSGVVTAIILWIYLRKILPHLSISQIKLKEWLSYLRESSAMAASLVVMKLYYTFDTFMLGILDQPSVVGWYNAAYKIVLFLIGIAGLLQTSFAPSFAREHTQLENLDKIVGKFSILLIFSASIFSGLLIITSQQLVYYLYGVNYAEATNVLLLLSISLYFIFLGTIFLGPLLFIGLQKKYLNAVSLGAIVNVILNLLLIPRYSYWGAGSATIFSNVVILLIGYLYYKKVIIHTNVVKKIGLNMFIFIVNLILSFVILKSSIERALLFSLVFSGSFYLANLNEINSLKLIKKS